MLGVLRWIIHQTSATPLCAPNAHNKSVCVCLRGAHSLKRGRQNFFGENGFESGTAGGRSVGCHHGDGVSPRRVFLLIWFGELGWGVLAGGWGGGVCVWSPSEPLCQALISLVVPAVSLMNFLEYPKARKAQLLFHNASVTIFFNKHQTCFCLLVAFSLYAQLYSSLSICQSIPFCKISLFFLHAYTNIRTHAQTIWCRRILFQTFFNELIHFSFFSMWSA